MGSLQFLKTAAHFIPIKVDAVMLSTAFIMKVLYDSRNTLYKRDCTKLWTAELFFMSLFLYLKYKKLTNELLKHTHYLTTIKQLHIKKISVALYKYQNVIC